MQKQHEYWGKLSEKITQPSEIKNKRSYTSDIDIEFLRKYLKKDFTLLDLGSGTGEIINQIYVDVKRIVAVELFPRFTKFIVNDPVIEIVHEDLRQFYTDESFDIITTHGVLQCFNTDDAYKLYKGIYGMLKDGGFYIQRIHCGIHEDHIVDGYSEELQSNYYANFRHIDKEIDYLKSLNFKTVECFDLHGPELNRWENTHHYTIVCSK